MIRAAVMLLAWHAAEAAAPRQARIGYLEFVRSSDGEVLYRAFVEALQGHGYTEGRNLQMVRRSAEGHAARLRELAVQLAAANVDVLLAASVEAARAAMHAAPKTRVVFVMSGDPVFEGLVASLARPKGNLTGLMTPVVDLSAKRLQILKDAFPRIRTVALVGSNVSISRTAIAEAARRLDVSVLQFPVHDYADYREAAAGVAQSAADAILVVEDAEAVTRLNDFVRLMMATRRPVMFTADIFAENFGLMAFGVSLREQYARAADFVVKLLQGIKPSDLPVEQSLRYQLVVNLRSAEEYGHTLPRDFLLRADRVIH